MLFSPPILKFFNYICHIILKTRQIEVFKKIQYNVFYLNSTLKLFHPTLFFQCIFILYFTRNAIKKNTYPEYLKTVSSVFKYIDDTLHSPFSRRFWWVLICLISRAERMANGSGTSPLLRVAEGSSLPWNESHNPHGCCVQRFPLARVPELIPPTLVFTAILIPFL